MSGWSSGDLVEHALREARDLDGCVAIVTESSRADLRWARTTLTTNGVSRARDIVLIGFRGTDSVRASASLSQSAPDLDSMAELVGRVRALLDSAPDAEDAAPLIGGAPPSSDWDAPAMATDADVFASLTAPLGDVFRRSIADDMELFGYAEHAVTSTWLGSSTGLRARHDQPQGRFEMTAKSHGRSRSAWWGVATDTFTDVDLVSGDRHLRQSLEWQGRRIDIPAGRHRAVLSPSAVGDLMVDLWWTASARDAVDGRSVFSGPDGTTRLGEQLSSHPLQLISDPTDPTIPAAPFLTTAMSSESSSVFDNGATLTPVSWLKDGRLGALAAPRAFATRHGLPFVASPDTIRFESTDASGDIREIIGAVDDGLLVTCLWYNRLVDPQTMLLTGLTRDGVFVVRGGEIIGATTNFRFNDSPVGLLDRIERVGAARRTLPREMGDYAPRVVMPPVIVADFNFSTVSDAL